ncbi:MAG: hypothetical protein WA667_00255 [Candidatus Nitrosopolaris sp.]
MERVAEIGTSNISKTTSCTLPLEWVTENHKFILYQTMRVTNSEKRGEKTDYDVNTEIINFLLN